MFIDHRGNCRVNGTLLVAETTGKEPEGVWRGGGGGGSGVLMLKYVNELVHSEFNLKLNRMAHLMIRNGSAII